LISLIEMNCEYCENTFKNKWNLLNHQKTAKYCLSLQDKTDEKSKKFNCRYCGVCLSSKQRLNSHIKVCNANTPHVQQISEKYEERILELQLQNKRLETEINIYKDLSEKSHNDIQKLENIILEKDTKLQEIAMTAIEQKNEVISNMVKKYVKKQPRKQFECSNVVYILTTSSLKKDRRYILGKAKNLTNRLSTYNKTDEHEVIYYQDCDDEESMNALEPLVFKKLSQYREQANRERFILPEDTDIDLFIDTIKSCFEFLK
jgi:hypothetical protein